MRWIVALMVAPLLSGCIADTPASLDGDVAGAAPCEPASFALAVNETNDADGDGVPLECDANPNDGPLGDLDFDWVDNQNDTCAHGFDQHDINKDGTPDACDPMFPMGDPLAPRYPAEDSCWAIAADNESMAIGIRIGSEYTFYCGEADQANATWIPLWDKWDAPAPFCIHVEQGERDKVRVGVVAGDNSGGFCGDNDDTTNGTYGPWTAPMSGNFTRMCYAFQQDGTARIRLGFAFTYDAKLHCDSRDPVIWGPRTGIHGLESGTMDALLRL